MFFLGCFALLCLALAALAALACFGLLGLLWLLALSVPLLLRFQAGRGSVDDGKRALAQLEVGLSPLRVNGGDVWRGKSREAISSLEVGG